MLFYLYPIILDISMPSQPPPNENPDQRLPLLLQAVELFTEELSVLAEHKWEDLPDLKKKKVVLAGRFRGIDWQPGPAEPLDLMTFKTQMAELENQSRQKIQGQLDLLSNQIYAMQELHQFWRESLSISFRKFYDPVPVS
jgi:hypothetical protein